MIDALGRQAGGASTQSLLGGGACEWGKLRKQSRMGVEPRGLGQQLIVPQCSQGIQQAFNKTNMRRGQAICVDKHEKKGSDQLEGGWV